MAYFSASFFLCFFSNINVEHIVSIGSEFADRCQTGSELSVNAKNESSQYVHCEG